MKNKKIELIPKIGDTIKAFGQTVKIIDITEGKVYLEHPIVVSGKEYTRDYIKTCEIQEILW